ncbi:MAG: hypothetical protein AAF223_01915 [Bacteroidota bacterium]
MELQLKIVGGLLIALATIHIIFPRYFRWKEELATVSLVNRQIMYIHTLFIALVLLLMGLLCLTSSTELIATVLGKRIAAGLGFFWLIRLFVQFVGYSSKLWRGKTFETTVHVLFSLLWLYFIAVFIGVYWW